MQEYSFEYTKQGIAYLLFFLSFAIIGLFSFILSRVLLHLLILDIILSIIIGVGVFLLNKYRIKKSGSAKLLKDELILELPEKTRIAFKDLKYYYSYNGKNGIVFTLGFLDGRKVKITANNNFCDVEPLKGLIADFQSAVDDYKTQNSSSVIHLESTLARRGTPYILSAISVLVILGYIFLRMPAMIISIAFTLPIMVSWIQYFRLKSNNKLVDF